MENQCGMSSAIRSSIASTLAENLVKVGVEFYEKDPSKVPQMLAFDRTRPLIAFIGELCTRWMLENPETYGLQFSNNSPSSTPTYITEKTRDDIKQGSVLVLVPSAARSAATIVDKINMGDGGMKQQAIQQLATFAPDPTFAQEFINQQGISLLINIVEGGGWEKSPATAALGEVTASVLGAFYDLLELHGIVSWDVVDQTFITKISSYVNKSSCDEAVVQASLAILESLLLNSSKQALVEKEISLLPLIEHLKKKSIKPSILSFINAIFVKSSTDDAREKLAQGILSSGMRDIILADVLPLNQTPKPEVARQVYILQSHIMKVVHQRIGNTRLERESDVADKEIGEIRKITSAILAEIPHSPGLFRKNSDTSEEFHRLGFRNAKNPLDDLSGVPEGSLILDCMYFFATKRTDLFRQWVLESFSRETSECPFLIASIEVVRLLLETFHVGSPPADQGGQYDRLVFSTDYPFEEAFSLAMHTLSRTWKEMKASGQDFWKVMGVLKEEVELSLRDSPVPPGTVEGWRERLKEYSYGRINKIRLDRKNAKEELESKAEPIVQLKEMLRPEVLATIAENRLRHMQKGGRFAHRERGGFRSFQEKRQSWFCKLSANKKFLHYGDVEDSSVPVEELPHIPVNEIRSLLTGKDCPHVKSKKSSSALAFSLVLVGDKKTMDFIAPNEKEFHMWTDGIHCLLGEPMGSPLAASDMENLLTWEIKLRLLGTEGIAIPDKMPEIPPIPTNFNFKIQL